MQKSLSLRLYLAPIVGMLILPLITSHAQTNCVIPAAGLVSWWRGEYNAVDGVGTNHGVLQNGAGFGSGRVGQALSFDGNSNYVTIPASASLNVGSGSGLTIECWIKPSELSVARPLVEYNNGVKDGVSLWISQPWVANQGGPGDVFANIADTGGGTHALVSAPGILTTNQFHHVAVTYDQASGLGVLYADGVVVFAANLGTFTPQTSYNLFLGLRPAGSLYPSIYSGLMDEVSVYSRALTTNEIQAVFAAGSAGKCTTRVPPYILSQPTNQTVSAGTTVTFAVLAGGTPPLRYQWSFNGSPVSDATNASLIFTNVGADRTGVYVVTVTNLMGSILSSNAVLTVNAVPPATLLNVNFAANQVKTGFAATGQTGSDFWNSLWFPFQSSVGFGGLKLADGTATAAGLTVQNGAGHTGFSHPDLMYQSCCYAQDYGVITLTVTNLPTGAYEFYLYGHAGADTANTVFQLLVGGNDFGNQSTATNSSWSLTNWVEGAQYVVYRGVTVTNGGAPVIVKCHPGVSGYTYLNGLQIKAAGPTPPVIVSQPASQSALVGADVTFSVTAGGTAPLSYQWSFNGTNLAGATASSLTKTNVRLGDAGNYAVAVSNSVTTVTSSNAVLTVNPPLCVPAPSSLVGWWPGEGNANDSTGGNPGVLGGGVAFVGGAVGQTFSFNGSNAYVSFAASSNLNVGAGGGLTIECWLNPENTTTSQQIAEWNNGAGGIGTFLSHSISAYGGLGSLFADFRDTLGNDHYFASSPGILVAGVFQHVAMTYDKASGVGKLFLNGSQVASEVLGSFTPQTSYPLYLGERASGLGTGQYFKGQMDEVSIYSRALATNEIQAIYNAGSNGKCVATNPPSCIAPSAGVVSWWRAEGNAVDAAGTSTGTIIGGLTFTSGEVGQAFNLNGFNAYVSFAASPNLNVGAGGGLTIECWLKPGDVANPQAIVEWNNGAGGDGAQLWHSIDALGGLGSLFANLRDTSGNDHYFATSPNLLDPSDFQHIALTYDKISGVAKLYRNGVTAATQNLGVFTPQTSYPFYLGTRFSGSGAGAFYKGLIDEMAVYNRALTTNEIQAIYNAGSAGKCSTPAPPVVFTQPTNQTVAAGASVTFAVAAGGSPPLRYQWSFNSNMLVNATNASLTITNAGVDQAGVYAVTITNMFGSTFSSNANLTVLVFPPSLLLQPTNQTQVAGETTTLVVTASGTAPLSYQWSFNDAALPGATSHSLVLTNLAANQAGVYSVTVTNLYGSRTSSNTTLAVVFLTTNLFDDFDPGIDLPQWTSFGGTVQATNHGGFISPSNSLWFGGTGSRFAITRSINTTNSWAVRFHLRIASGAPPFWDRPELPADGVVLEYSTNAGVNWIEFGRYNTTTFYNWTPVSALIPAGAKVPTARFRWRQLANSGSISDHWALDDVLLTTVVTPPAILTQPLNQTVSADGPATFSAGVSGSLPLNYQWRLNGTDLSGATNSSLTLSNVQPSQAGDYSLHVANVAGVAVSSNAVLKVTVISALGNGQLLTGPAHYFSGSLSVQLTNHFPGGLIFHTLDGSAPSFASSPYLGPFQVSQTVVLRAIGYRADFLEFGELGPITILKVPGFTLSVSSAGGGSITLNPPGGDYSSNSVVSLTAVPNPGWMFLKWLGDADGSSSSTNVTVTRNKSVQAVFGTTLNTTAAGGGSVALNPPGGLYAFGSLVQITAIPNAGNFFGIWGSAASGNVNPLLFTVTNPNPTVSSIFGAVGSGQAALTVVPVGRGQVSINPRANVYPTNSAVTITATPDAGQAFLGWSGNANGTQNPLQLTLDSSKLIYANFTRRPQLTAEMLRNEGFRLSLNGDGVATYRLEMSTNLTGWEALAEMTNAVGNAQFIDLAATNSIQRFYRALFLP